MARPKTDNDATKNLKPEDETQQAKKGTRIGLLSKRDVLADFKKIVRARKTRRRTIWRCLCAAGVGDSAPCRQLQFARTRSAAPCWDRAARTYSALAYSRPGRSFTRSLASFVGQLLAQLPISRRIR